MDKKIGEFLTWKFLGLVFLLLIILGINIFGKYYENSLFNDVVLILNQNILNIILIGVFFVMGELLHFMKKPYKNYGFLFDLLAVFFFLRLFFNFLGFLGGRIENAGIIDYILHYSFLTTIIVLGLFLIINLVRVFLKK